MHPFTASQPPVLAWRVLTDSLVLCAVVVLPCQAAAPSPPIGSSATGGVGVGSVLGSVREHVSEAVESGAADLQALAQGAR
jgi:hypothetical protein